MPVPSIFYRSRSFSLLPALLMVAIAASPLEATDITAPWTTSIDGGFTSGEWQFLNDGTNTFGSVLVDTSEGVLGGTLTFTGFSTLTAMAEASISDGTLSFSGNSSLEASVENAVVGGTQTFDDNSSLEASTANAIVAGTQTFYDTTVLNASVTCAVSGGTQTFSGNSMLNASGNSAVSGGCQIFSENATLQAGAAGAIRDTTVTLQDSARLEVNADNAIGTGVTLRFGNGGILELNGHDATVGAIACDSVGGIIRNGAAAPSTFTMDTADTDSTFGGNIVDGEGGGALGVDKTGDGTLVLRGNNTFTGGLSIDGGTVIAASPTALGASGVTISTCGMLRGAPSVAFGNAITVRGAISPGDYDAPVAEMTTGSETWAGGGTYYWDVNSATGFAGTSWDHLDVNGALDLTATPSDPFTIAVSSFSDLTSDGAANFNPDDDYSWTILATTGGISGLTGENYRIDATDFFNIPDSSSSWTLTTDGTSLFLHYAAFEISSPWTTSIDGNFESGHWKVVNDGINTLGTVDADTAGGVYDGSLTFAGLSVLRATAGYAIDGGELAFSGNSSLQASVEGAISGGDMTFSDHSSLDLGAARAFTYGSAEFYDASVLNATVGHVFSDEGFLGFYGNSILKAAAGQVIDADTGVEFSFNENSSLEATAADAVAGGMVLFGVQRLTFRDSAILKALVASAVSGGSQGFSGNSSLEAFAENAVTGGTQAFTDSASLKALVTSAVSGGEQSFLGNATLIASAPGAVRDTTISLGDSARLVANADQSLGGGVTLRFMNGGSVEINGAGETITAIASDSVGGAITAGSGATPTVTFQTEGLMSFDGRLLDGDGALAVEKIGTGTLRLSGDNVFSKGLDIREGTVVAGGSTSLGTDAVSVDSAGTLLAVPNLEVGNGVDVRGTISPGDEAASVSSLTTAGQTWHDTGAYRWDLSSATGLAGSSWDLLVLNGALTLTSTSSDPFTIAVTSFLDLAPGDAANFDPGNDYSWTILTASGGIAGFTGDNYRIDTTNFTNEVFPGSRWTLTTDGTSLFLNYKFPGISTLWTTSVDGSFESGSWKVLNDGISTFGAVVADTAGGVHGGSLAFTGLSTLRAMAGSAVDAGTQTFSDNSMLNASESLAVSGGTQMFSDTTVLNASASCAVSGGTQMFSGNSILNASVSSAISGGSQSFSDNATLQAGAAEAIRDTTVTLQDSARLEVNADDAIGTGVTLRFGNGGGILELNGHDATVGEIASDSVGGLIRNGAAAPSILTMDTAGGMAFNGNIVDGSGGGALGVVKAGAGTLVLSGNNAFTGGLSIDGGTVIAASSTALGASGVTVSAGGALGGTPSVTFGNAVTVQGTISPGTADVPVANMTTGHETWAGGGTYRWDLNNATGFASTNWDSLNVNGTLTLIATPGDPVTIAVNSFSGLAPGDAANFDPGNDYTWTILITTGGISGFTGDNYRIDTTGFTNALLPSSSWLITSNGNDVILNYSGTTTLIGTPRTTSVGGSFESGNWKVLNDGISAFGAVVADTAGGVHGGSLAFTGLSVLRAATGSAVDGGTQIFDDNSSLEASAANAIVAGTQTFSGNSSLEAAAQNAITGGTQTFSDSSSLEALAQDAFGGSAHAIFQQTSSMSVSASGAVSGGTLTFNDATVLNASATSAISGGAQIFRGNSMLNASVDSAVSGGSQSFLENATLQAGSAGAIRDTTITLSDAARLAVGADNALGANVTLSFVNGGIFELNGHAATLGAFGSNSGAAGTIRNGAAAPATLTMDTAGNMVFGGNIVDGSGGGTLGVRKTGVGTLVLGGNSSFTGGLLIDGGTVIAASSTALGALGVTISSGTMLGGGPSVAFGNAVMVRGTISPGTSDAPVSKMTTGNETWAGGGTYRWDLNNATGGAGGNWDYLVSNGALMLTATSSDPFTIAVNSFSGMAPGDAANFIAGNNYTWTILTTTGGISGFSQASYRIDTTGFTNGVLPGSSWLLTSNGSDLILNYSGTATLIGAPRATSAAGSFESGNWKVLNDGISTFGAVDADTAGGVHGGSLAFTGLSTLRATAGSAVDAGTQTFSDNSMLNASASLAVSGGTQMFSDNSMLKASVDSAVSGGSQSFHNSSVLSSAATNAVSGGMQTFFDNSMLKASVSSAVSGGTQTFSGNSMLNASVSSAVSGGSQSFSDNATLQAGAVGAIRDTTVTLQGAGRLLVNADNAIGTGVTLRFGNGGGILELNGHDATVGEIASDSVGGLIRNGAAAPSILTMDTAGGMTFNGNIVDGSGGGALGVVKAGAGTLVLSGNNAFTGGLSIDGGTVIAASSTALGASGVTVSAGGALGGTPSVTFGNAVTVQGTISPGTVAAPIVRMTTGNETWAGGGTYRWDLSSTTGGAGASWDYLVLNGALTLTATLSDPFTIAVNSFSGLAPGGVANFNPANNYTWTILTTSGGISGLGQTNYRIDTTGFTNPVSPTSAWTLTSNGSNLILSYNATATTLISTGWTTSTAGSFQSGIWKVLNDGVSSSGRVTANTAGGVHGGSLTFTGLSVLRAAVGSAVDGGTQMFSGTSSLEASSQNAVSGGTQIFDDSSVLKTLVGSAVSGGSQAFFGNSSLNAGSSGVSGGTQSFAENATLQAGGTDAISNTTVTLSDSARLVVSANDAIGTGVTLRFGSGGILELNGHDATVGAIASDSVGGIIRNGAAQGAHIVLNTAGSMAFDGSVVDGSVGGKLGVRKTGAGTLVLSGSSSFTGGLSIDGGTVIAASSTALGASAVTVSSGAMLGGTPSVAFGNIVSVKGTISPGTTVAPVANMTTGNETWAGGGAYRWDLNSATGSAGTNWDLLNVNGTLTLSATSGSPFEIAVTSFSGLAPGDAANFDPNRNYTWSIGTATGGIFGLVGNNYRIDASGFGNTVAPGSAWTLSTDGNNLFLNYNFAAVPEPGSWGMLMVAGLLFALLRRRQRP